MTRWRLLTLLGIALLLAGCGLVGGLAETQRALEREGYDGVSIDIEQHNTTTSLRVRYTSRAETREARVQEITDVAETVWTTAPLRFDELQVQASVPTGTTDATASTFTRAQLVEQFGDRPATLQENDVEDVGRSVLRWLAVGGLLFLAGVATLIAVLVRGRRRRTAALSGPWGQVPPAWPAPPGSPPSPPSPPPSPDDPWRGPPD